MTDWLVIILRNMIPEIEEGHLRPSFYLHRYLSSIVVLREVEREETAALHRPVSQVDVPLVAADLTGDLVILQCVCRSLCLGVALEYLAIPSSITCLFIGKSTYARMGVIANTTPGEAGWCGHLTLEFSNSSGADCRIYANEGIVQALFMEGEPCAVSYENRSGKYQNQPERVTLARV